MTLAQMKNVLVQQIIIGVVVLVQIKKSVKNSEFDSNKQCPNKQGISDEVTLVQTKISCYNKLAVVQ
jgi:hypothetical protein